MDSFMGAVAVLVVFITAFSLLDLASVRLGVDSRPPEPAREWWERG